MDEPNARLFIQRATLRMHGVVLGLRSRPRVVAVTSGTRTRPPGFLGNRLGLVRARAPMYRGALVGCCRPERLRDARRGVSVKTGPLLSLSGGA
jgi:hypothetical protein